MDRKTAIAIALVVALTTLPAPVGAETSAPEGWALTLTSDGPEVAPRSALPAGGFNEAECGGEAPSETYCTTLLHTGMQVFSASLSANFGYTGTLEVRLFHATSVLVFQAHVIDGSPVGFNNYGNFPTTPAIFWHECFSYELGQSGSNPLPLPLEENGTPGGTGVWGCGVAYA